MTENKTSGNDMSFLEHLEALRWHLVRSVVVVMTLAIVLFCMKELIFDVIIFGPKKTDFITYRLLCKFSHFAGKGDEMCVTSIPFSLINTDLAGQFTMHMWIAFVGGLIAGIPYVLWELWRFIRPALTEKERGKTRGFVFFSTALFLSGVCFSYFIVVPLTVLFLGSYQVSSDVLNMISMDSYISTVTTLTLVTGIVFELPIVIYFLTRFGIITPDFMRKYRKHAVVVILIVGAVITPSPDIASQLLVAFPLYLLYEASIFVSKYVVKQQSAQSL